MTSISIDRKTKDFLARQKRSLENTEGTQFTWDEFFERAFSVRKPAKLTQKEIEELKRLVGEARPWKPRALTRTP
ncbi:MAG: VapB-type antitoxin [Thaumarchaeota archaeon]|nr:VapB-type antitoxin [Nitrososphaerota archaeon]